MKLLSKIFVLMKEKVILNIKGDNKKYFKGRLKITERFFTITLQETSC